jgi:hypothetical protein
MIVGKRLRRIDNLMQVGVHEFRDQIHILEALPVYGHHYILQTNNVLVAEVPKELQLAQHPQRLLSIAEDIVYLFDRDLLVGLLVY